MTADDGDRQPTAQTDDPLDRVVRTCTVLHDLLLSDPSCPEVELRVADFANAVDRAMDVYRAGKIRVEMHTMIPLMYEFAVSELPELCRQGPDALERARKQLRLFLTTMEQLLRPRLAEQ